MRKIRAFAESVGHEIVGKLTRRSEWGQARDERWYIDEAGNEYFATRYGVTFITVEGTAI